jgi:minor extracellular serine protease Vpr
MSKFFNKSSVNLMVAMALGITSTSTIARSVIVELNDAPAAHNIYKAQKAGTPLSVEKIQALRSDLARKQDDFLQTLKAIGIHATLESVNIPLPDNGSTNIEYRYTLVFNGMTLDVADASISALASLAEVKKVHEVKVLKPLLNASVKYTRAPELYGERHELTASDNFNEGFEGQGVYVAVIDSGIDWANPMFGDDVTPPRHGVAPPIAGANNNKVAYYLPLTGEGMDSMGHGTHVAATAAGYSGWASGDDGIPNTGDDVALHGVAPQAKIMAYQVCSGVGSAALAPAGLGACISKSILLALEDAVSPRSLTGYAKPVADVINLSLGGPGGPDDASAVAASNAALAGAVVVAAAGNDGPGESTVGSPAAGRHVIAVAASNDPGVFSNSIEVFIAGEDVVDEDVSKLSAALAAASNLMRPITEPIISHYVFAGLADTPDQVPLSVLGNICLALRGSTHVVADNATGTFTNKAANCQAKGAIATLIYNSESGEIGPIKAEGATPVVTISGVAGETLQDFGYDMDGVSLRAIQLNPLDPELFVPGIAGFSSVGPIAGSGQIKADLAAPGVAILAATTKTGPPTASMMDASGYIEASGTSMASPHVAGAAALVLQANPSWSVATVRAALMNTATNPRFNDGSEKAHDLSNDSILAQGAGLIDVRAAAQTTAIMGVTGDGIIEPEFLASYSFGTFPVVNTRVEHTEEVIVTLQGLNTSETTYKLTFENNRELDVDGIDVTLSEETITVNANGTDTFTVLATIDGDKVRDFGEASKRQMMWYVIAEPIEGGETLRMPFYLNAGMSELGSGPDAPDSTDTKQSEEQFTGSILVGDSNTALIDGTTYRDHTITLDDGAAFQLMADLSYTGNGADDIDLFLLDPDGEEIASSANGLGTPEHIEVAVTRSGTYTYRVSGWVNAEVDYQLTSTTLTSDTPTDEFAASAPVLSQSEIDFTDNSGQALDFDGNITLQWNAVYGAEQFEIEQSTDGVNFTSVEVVSADILSYSFSDREDGTHSYRVRAWFNGKIGSYISAPSNVVEVLVDSRSKLDITAQTKTAISNLNLADGVFSLDLSITNTSDSHYVPTMEMQVANIVSNSGTVKLINADSGGDGMGENRGMFDYSQSMGSDEVFTANETSDVRTLEFSNAASEMFSYDLTVTAHEQNSSSSTSSSGAAGQEEDASQPTLEEQVLRVTINPLTGSVMTELVMSSLTTVTVKPLMGL